MSTLTSVARLQERIEIDPFALRRFSVAEYHKMIVGGILTPDDRVELLEGWIVKKMSQNPPHSSSIARCIRRLARVLPERWTLRVEAPITLSDSEPEPDIVIARGDEDLYDRRHPKPRDIAVVMEIADSTLLNDRHYKRALYAQERIAEYWLINLVERKIEVYTKPRGGKYRTLVEYGDKEKTPLILDGVKIAEILVNELIAKT